MCLSNPVNSQAPQTSTSMRSLAVNSPIYSTSRNSLVSPRDGRRSSGSMQRQTCCLATYRRYCRSCSPKLATHFLVAHFLLEGDAIFQSCWRPGAVHGGSKSYSAAGPYFRHIKLCIFPDIRFALQVVEQADSLALPDSVVQYFRGEIGQPPGGFPEPITSRVRKGRPMVDGTTHFSERPVRCSELPVLIM